MGDFLKYKSFLSSVEYSVDDNCLFGKVMFIKSLLTYEGETLQELEKIFHQTIDRQKGSSRMFHAPATLRSEIRNVLNRPRLG